jgi:cytochrome b
MGVKMKSQLVYDLPTRIFHWCFAGLFLTAFIIAKTIDDDSPTYAFHMLAGLTLTFLVLLRILWGIFGTKHARISGFALNPMDLVHYFKGILTNDKKRWAGHNPASSWAGIAMMAMGLGLGITGYLMTSGDQEAYEDIHELFSNAFIVLVILHVTGIIVHTLRMKEMIGLSMINGKKVDVPSDQVIASSQPVVGMLLVALLIAFGLFLNKNFDSKTGNLKFFGTTLQLSEQEGAGEGGESEGDEGDD